MAHFSVDVLTPNKVLATNIQAESLLIPTSSGQINILRDHTHLVTKLEIGPLTIFGGPDEPDRSFVVTKGICKVMKHKVVILTHVGNESSNIDVDRAKASLDNAQNVLKTENLSPYEFEEATHKVERARLRIHLGETYKGKIK
ncbi:MAG: ATP synthase F1 subunit epsilon [Epsilonproteobacteria bacterium]|nr:MAG: ATP synthase F1 subunit epsilon [Campylobacterota bacterium]RLA67584.1 MAG: ATP synthase F1 subunit epsilon [Campylobacterota bacterium]